MSTKAIREALEQLNRWRVSQDQAPITDALAEVEAIEKACAQLKAKGCGTSEHDPVLYSAHQLLKSIGEESTK